VRLERRLGGRSEGAGQQPHRTRRHIDLDEPFEPRQVEADGDLEAAGLDAADHRAATAERHHRDTRGRGPVEDVDDVLLGGRPHNHVGQVGELAPQTPDQVAIGPADAVPCPVDRIDGPQGRE
jgi:hypothetical protein